MRTAEDPIKRRADPGNAAELLAVIQAGGLDLRAGVLLDEKTLDGIIDPLLVMIAKRGPSGLNLKELMDVVEQCIIFRVLTRFRWHQARAAEFLGLKPQTLSEKIKRAFPPDRSLL
jgi:DNA-binding NtrC family response regulator